MNLDLIRTLMKKEEFEEALQLLDEAVAVEPENSTFWKLRGDAIQLTDSADGLPLAESEKCYLKALALNPNDLEAIESLAHYYDAVAGNLEVAKEYAERYLKLVKATSADMNQILEQ